MSGMAGDQHAALFGQACFVPGMAKVTFGTGSFVLMNAGPVCPAPVDGLVTTVAWDLGVAGERPTGPADAADGRVAGGLCPRRLRLRFGCRGAVAAGRAGHHRCGGRGRAAGPVGDGKRGCGGGPGLHRPRQPALGPGRPGDHRRVEPRHRAGPSGPSHGGGDELPGGAMCWRPWPPRPPRRPCSGSTGAPRSWTSCSSSWPTSRAFAVVRPDSVETTALGAATLAGLAEGLWGSLDELGALWTEEAAFAPAAAVAEAEAGRRAWERPSTAPAAGAAGPEPQTRSDHPRSAMSAMIETHWRSRSRNTGSSRPTTTTSWAWAMQAVATTGVHRRRRRLAQGRPGQGLEALGVGKLALRRPPPGARRPRARRRNRRPGCVRTRSTRRSSRAGGESCPKRSVTTSEQFGMAIGQLARHRAQGLDGDAVDLEDLVTQEVDELAAGQAHPELVHHHAPVSLEDLDGDHVPADRADPAGHRPERTRSIRKVHPDQVIVHRTTLGGEHVRTVSTGLRPEFRPAAPGGHSSPRTPGRRGGRSRT